MRYRFNRYCSCARCRAHGYMGPAVLITIGVLFLLDQTTHMHWADFSFTWPALLIVIGLIKLLEHGASVAGHIPREYGATLPPNPSQIVPPGTSSYATSAQGPVVTPPPMPTAGAITAGSAIVRPEDREAHNG